MNNVTDTVTFLGLNGTVLQGIALLVAILGLLIAAVTVLIQLSPQPNPRHGRALRGVNLRDWTFDLARRITDFQDERQTTRPLSPGAQKSYDLETMRLYRHEFGDEMVRLGEEYVRKGVGRYYLSLLYDVQQQSPRDIDTVVRFLKVELPSRIDVGGHSFRLSLAGR